MQSDLIGTIITVRSDMRGSPMFPAESFPYFAMMPDFVLVSHAHQLFHAARGTIRMAALRDRVRSVQAPWGLMVSTADMYQLYPLRDQFVFKDGRIFYTPAEGK